MYPTMPVGLTPENDSVIPGMSVGRFALKFQLGNLFFRKSDVITPFPASPRTRNWEAGHTFSSNGALKTAPYAPALEPVTKTISGLTKCSRAHFSATFALWKPWCTT